MSDMVLPSAESEVSRVGTVDVVQVAPSMNSRGRYYIANTSQSGGTRASSESSRGIGRREEMRVHEPAKPSTPPESASRGLPVAGRNSQGCCPYCESTLPPSQTPRSAVTHEPELGNVSTLAVNGGRGLNVTTAKEPVSTFESSILDAIPQLVLPPPAVPPETPESPLKKLFLASMSPSRTKSMDVRRPSFAAEVPTYHLNLEDPKKLWPSKEKKSFMMGDERSTSQRNGWWKRTHRGSHPRSRAVDLHRDSQEDFLTLRHLPHETDKSSVHSSTLHVHRNDGTMRKLFVAVGRIFKRRARSETTRRSSFQRLVVTQETPATQSLMAYEAPVYDSDQFSLASSVVSSQTSMSR
jgi:hypothetical protein